MKKTYHSVPELVREMSETGSFADAFESRLAERKLVKELMVVRATQGLSQKDMALKLGCTQSRISKLESMTDAEFRIGDLAKYAQGLGLELTITLESTDRSATARARKRGEALDTTREHSRRKAVST